MTTLPNPQPPPRGGHSKRGAHFDPDELCARLNAHLARQKQKSDARRAARARPGPQPLLPTIHPSSLPNPSAFKTITSGLPYTPRVAAAAFERTTTPSPPKPKQPLSRPPSKLNFDFDFDFERQLSPASFEKSMPRGIFTELQRRQAFDNALAARARDQYVWSERENERAHRREVELCKPVQRTFVEFEHLAKRDLGVADKENLGLGFGGDEREGERPKREEYGALAPVVNPRVPFGKRRENDWAQHEEVQKAEPLVRKRQSLWVMKGRKEKAAREEQGDVVVEEEEEKCDSPPSPSRRRTRGRSFLAWF